MKNKLNTLYKWFWKEVIINWFWKGIIGGTFRGIKSGISPSVSQAMIILTPIIISYFIVSYFDKPIMEQAVNFQENYMEQALNLSLETKIIRSLTGVQFWSNVLFDSLSTEKINEKQIDSEYKNLKKFFLHWQDDFNENLKFIKDNVSEKYVIKRKCLSVKKELISESECKLKKVNQKFKTMYGKLSSCYDSRKRKKSCDYTISSFNQVFRTPIGDNIIQFYKTFRKEQKN